MKTKVLIVEGSTAVAVALLVVEELVEEVVEEE